MNFWHLQLEKPFQKYRRGTGENNLGIVALVFNAFNDSPDTFALAEKIGGNLFGLGQQHFVTFIIEEQNFLFQNLIHLGTDNLPHPFDESVIKAVFLQFQNLGREGLP